MGHGHWIHALTWWKRCKVCGHRSTKCMCRRPSLVMEQIFVEERKRLYQYQHQHQQQNQHQQQHRNSRPQRLDETITEPTAELQGITWDDDDELDSFYRPQEQPVRLFSEECATREKYVDACRSNRSASRANDRDSSEATASSGQSLQHQLSNLSSHYSNSRGRTPSDRGILRSASSGDDGVVLWNQESEHQFKRQHSQPLHQKQQQQPQRRSLRQRTHSNPSLLALAAAADTTTQNDKYEKISHKAIRIKRNGADVAPAMAMPRGSPGVTIVPGLEGFKLRRRSRLSSRMSSDSHGGLNASSTSNSLRTTSLSVQSDLSVESNGGSFKPSRFDDNFSGSFDSFIEETEEDDILDELHNYLERAGSPTGSTMSPVRECALFRSSFF